MKDLSLLRPLARSSRSRGGLKAGQSIEVIRGGLSGLSGVLVCCIADGRWVVRMDGQAAGVELVVVAAALQRKLGSRRS